jgi:hypothetical protein
MHIIKHQTLITRLREPNLLQLSPIHCWSQENMFVVVQSAINNNDAWGQTKKNNPSTYSIETSNQSNNKFIN